MSDRVSIIICNNLRAEALAVKSSEGLDDIDYISFPGRCGQMRPIQWEKLKGESGISQDDSHTILASGKYCIQSADSDLERLILPGDRELNQCFELLINADVISHLQMQGAYLTIPGWLKNWEKHIDIWGFDKTTARSFFKESNQHIILLDTGIHTDIENSLIEFANFVDLPYQIMPVGLSHFSLILKHLSDQHALNRNRHTIFELNNKMNREIADYRMIADLISRLSDLVMEDQAIERVVDLFTMLFAPEQLIYASMKDEKIISTSPPDLSQIEKDVFLKEIKHFKEDYIMSESGTGFFLRVQHRDEIIGIMKIEGLVFMEYKTHYLNLALMINHVCGLAISNARKYQQLIDSEVQIKHYAGQLEEANEEVKQFAYIISHDLRAPLVNIQGFSYELKYAWDDLLPMVEQFLPQLDAEQTTRYHQVVDEDIPEAFKFISGSIERMENFINALLKLSRLGQLTISYTHIDLNSIIKGVLQDIAHPLETRNAQVTIGQLPDIGADSVTMEQVFANILNNAVKYWEPERPLEIEIFGEQKDQKVIIHIKDNGRGIAGDDLRQIFLPFKRSGPGGITGEGMGLAYVHTIMQRHNGQISCQSELGSGSEFLISLPILQEKGELDEVST